MSTPNTPEVQELIYDGVTATTLGEIFGLDHKEVNKRLHGRVTPLPKRDKYTRYRIRDAAPFLCESKIDPEEMIKSLTPSKLPAALQDAFWKAQLSRQKYLEKRGELWSTERVFEVVSTAFKVIRMTVLMFNDTVDQRAELTDEQRRIIQELGDGLLHSLNERLVEEFAFYMPPPDEHGPPVSDQPALPPPTEAEINARAEAEETHYRSHQQQEDPFA